MVALPSFVNRRNVADDDISDASQWRQQTPFTGELFLDRYGSGPLQVPTSMRRGLRYGAIEPDPTCVAELIALSRDLAARHRRLVLVFTPLHPDYRRAYPGVASWLAEIAAQVESATGADRTHVVSLHDHPDFAAPDFFDAVHLEWPGVKRLSKLILASMANPAP